jgi:hypothetical protein
MSSPRNEADLPIGEPIETYRIICFAALGLIAFVLFSTGFGPFALLPTTVGALMLIFAWASGPIMVLLLLGFLMHARFKAFGSVTTGQDRAADLIICAAALVFVVGFYRLRSLRTQIFPTDPRLPKGNVRIAPHRRSPGLVTRREIGMLIIAAPLWTLAALGFWALFMQSLKGLRYVPFWRNIWLIWTLSLVFITASAVISYWALWKWTRSEAILFLEDTLWQETRREQRRINRWLAWAKLRRWRGKTDSATT